ncbi:hypothetical protein FB451DRAFT_1230356 [Mycena latifolia]|nr:hypothetical protein FB451DRAFT_1230356 [Mycena latifolia]
MQFRALISLAIVAAATLVAAAPAHGAGISISIHQDEGAPATPVAVLQLYNEPLLGSTILPTPTMSFAQLTCATLFQHTPSALSNGYIFEPGEDEENP